MHPLDRTIDIPNESMDETWVVGDTLSFLYIITWAHNQTTDADSMLFLWSHSTSDKHQPRIEHKVVGTKLDT